MPLKQKKILLEMLPELERRVIRVKNEELTCPVCRQPDFAVIDGYTRRVVSDNLKEVKISGENVPSITIVCLNCGYILDFALGTLGFLEEGGEYGEKE